MILKTMLLSHTPSLISQQLTCNGNPFCDDFNDNSTYIDEIRSHLPNILEIDATVLPPRIGFGEGID